MAIPVARWQKRSWATPPPEGVVEVWRCPFRPNGIHPPEDIERAGRFRSADAAAAFLARRWAVRQVLAGVLDRDPAALVFDADFGGRPRIAGAPSWLSFSPSSAGDVTIVAVARDRLVGADLEAHVDDASVAPAWAMKEALVKALGVGLSLDVRRFELGSSQTHVTATAVGETLPRDWTVIPVPADGYGCAVAVEGDVEAVHCFDLDLEP